MPPAPAWVNKPGHGGLVGCRDLDTTLAPVYFPCQLAQYSVRCTHTFSHSPDTQTALRLPRTASPFSRDPGALKAEWLDAMVSSLFILALLDVSWCNCLGQLYNILLYDYYGKTWYYYGVSSIPTVHGQLSHSYYSRSNNMSSTRAIWLCTGQRRLIAYWTQSSRCIHHNLIILLHEVPVSSSPPSLRQLHSWKDTNAFHVRSLGNFDVWQCLLVKSLLTPSEITIFDICFHQWNLHVFSIFDGSASLSFLDGEAAPGTFGSTGSRRDNWKYARFMFKMKCCMRIACMYIYI